MILRWIQGEILPARYPRLFRILPHFLQWLYQHFCNSLHGRWCKKRLVPRLVNQLLEGSTTSGSHVQCVWTDQAVSESRVNQSKERVSGVCSFRLSEVIQPYYIRLRLRTIDQNLEIVFLFFLTWHGKRCRSVFQEKTKQHLMTSYYKCFSAGSCSKCWGVNRIVGISYYITKRTHCYCLIKLGVAFV